MRVCTNCVLKKSEISNNTSNTTICHGVQLSGCTGCMVDSCLISGVTGGAGVTAVGIGLDTGGSQNMITRNNISDLATSNNLGSLSGIRSFNVSQNFFKENCIAIPTQAVGVNVNGIEALGGLDAWIRNTIRVSSSARIGIPASVPRIIYDLNAGTVTPTPAPATALHNFAIID